MATQKGGQRPPVNGKLDGNVHYELNGQHVVRSIGRSKKPPTLPQRIARQATKVVSEFLNTVMAVVRIGFELKAKLSKTNQQNEAFSYHRKNAVTGVYPELRMDFSRIMLSMGTKSLPLDVKVEISAEGVNFSWDKGLHHADAHWTDQAMLVAYFPGLHDLVFLSGGARRNQGFDLLPLTGMPKGQVVHTYLSFVANDRTSISNSLYTGELYW